MSCKGEQDAVKVLMITNTLILQLPLTLRTDISYVCYCFCLRAAHHYIQNSTEAQGCITCGRLDIQQISSDMDPAVSVH